MSAYQLYNNILSIEALESSITPPPVVNTLKYQAFPVAARERELAREATRFAANAIHLFCHHTTPVLEARRKALLAGSTRRKKYHKSADIIWRELPTDQSFFWEHHAKLIRQALKDETLSAEQCLQHAGFRDEWPAYRRLAEMAVADYLELPMPGYVAEAPQRNLNADDEKLAAWSEPSETEDEHIASTAKIPDTSKLQQRSFDDYIADMLGNVNITPFTDEEMSERHHWMTTYNIATASAAHPRHFDADEMASAMARMEAMDEKLKHDRNHSLEKLADSLPPAIVNELRSFDGRRLNLRPMPEKLAPCDTELLQQGASSRRELLNTLPAPFGPVTSRMIYGNFVQLYPYTTVRSATTGKHATALLRQLADLLDGTGREFFYYYAYPHLWKAIKPTEVDEMIAAVAHDLWRLMKGNDKEEWKRASADAKKLLGDGDVLGLKRLELESEDPEVLKLHEMMRKVLREDKLRRVEMSEIAHDGFGDDSVDIGQAEAAESA